MAYFVVSSATDGIDVRYHAARVSSILPGSVVPAAVVVGLPHHDASMTLSIDEARTLLAALPGVLAQHDAAAPVPPPDGRAVA